MITNAPSPYVQIKGQFLTDHFSILNWNVITASNNSLLIYNTSIEPITLSYEEMAEFILSYDVIDKPTGLKITDVNYYVYDRGELLYKFKVLPGAEFDI